MVVAGGAISNLRQSNIRTFEISNLKFQIKNLETPFHITGCQ
jgi:hypothetical protein